MKLINLVPAVLLLFTSCEKLKQDNIIPEETTRLTELQARYKDLLVEQVDGWYIEYAPSINKGSISIWMDFQANGKVKIVSDLLPFNEEAVSTYRIAGVTRPEIIFDTYSVWSVIAEHAEGNFEFHIYPEDDGTFSLRNIFDKSDVKYKLRKANSEDISNIHKKAQIATQLSLFEKNASAYFKNLILENVSAFWEINVAAQQLKLTWEENGNTVSKDFSYENTAEGIRLGEVWKIGEVEVQEFKFGAQTSNTMEVSYAGGAGSGEIQVSHTPAFPYKGAAKRFIWSNVFNPNQETVRFYASVSGSRETCIENVSPALWPYYEKLWGPDVWPTFVRVQFYNYNGASHTNSIQLYGTVNGVNEWYAYFYAFDEIDDSHVMVRKRNEVPQEHNNYFANYASGTALNMYNSHPEIADFLDRIYPPGIGVTIVPLEGQKVRVVSRANSLYYVDLAISTPATFWSN